MTAGSQGTDKETRTDAYEHRPKQPNTSVQNTTFHTRTHTHTQTTAYLGGLLGSKGSDGGSEEGKNGGSLHGERLRWSILRLVGAEETTNGRRGVGRTC